MGKKIRVTCRICGNIIYKISSFNLLCHLFYSHKPSDIIDEKQRCMFCEKIINREPKVPWRYDLYKHIHEEHSFKDFFIIEPHNTIEFLEFRCVPCSNRKPSQSITCLMDKDSYVSNYVKPVCQWCLTPMALRRIKDREIYG